MYKKNPFSFENGFFGAFYWTRTSDTLINSQVL